MLEQQIKEMPRRDDAASEPVDETLSVVRQMMAEESRAAPKPHSPSAAPQEKPVVSTAPAAQRRRNPPIKGRAALPDLEEPVPDPQERRRAPREVVPDLLPRISMLSRIGALFPRRSRAIDGEGEVADQADLQYTREEVAAGHGQRRLSQAIREFRPTRKQIAFVVLVGIMLWRPWLIPGLLFVTFWVALIAYLSVGPDRVREIGQGRWEWFSARHPERAERVLTWAQRWADRMDGWLARLPERWTDGIYLPDLGRSQADAGPVEAQPDPFDRLVAQQQTAAIPGGRA